MSALSQSDEGNRVNICITMGSLETLIVIGVPGHALAAQLPITFLSCIYWF